MMKIGFVGCGEMGEPTAGQVLKSRKFEASPCEPPAISMNLDRRNLLKGAVSAGFASIPLLRATPLFAKVKSDPFSLGVAAGDPASDGFVIWTRLAPKPLDNHGGMPPAPVGVAWEVATDPHMTHVIRSGHAVAHVEVAHSVHVEIEGLEPARDYFYRFRALNAESAIGRARTSPSPGADVRQIRFITAGCQAWEGGYYTAWRRIAEESADFVFHYGDYIYENKAKAADKQGRSYPRTLPSGFPRCYTLTDYRRRYALYKTDADLQAAHASCPFIASFDDHEVANNWSADTDPKDTPPQDFLFRRAAAFQAWYEHMPVRRSLIPRGPDILAYRAFHFGNLADMMVLDTRQYRSHAPCKGRFRAHCTEADAPDRTMLGGGQEGWLAQNLQTAKGTWQVLAQQVLFSPLDWRSFPSMPKSDAPVRRMDVWDGASAGRARVMQALREAKIANAVVLTGDLHKALALELKDDWRNPKSACVGVEFLATSISSGGDGSRTVANEAQLRTDNPHLKFIGNERGYTRHVVTHNRWQADYRVVERVSSPGVPALTRKSFIVEAGHAGLMDA
jgi:alkaline phosphatase D